MAKKKSSPEKTSKKLVPMKAVLCPVCKGNGRVMNKVIKAHIKCRGCEGKGWVEVHYAEPVKAPKIKTLPYVPVQPDDTLRKEYDKWRTDIGDYTYISGSSTADPQKWDRSGNYNVTYTDPNPYDDLTDPTLTSASSSSKP
jgi:hypothetical protein